VSAAIGLAQLEKLDRSLKRREQINALYNEAFSNLEWLKIPPNINEENTSSFYFYWVQTKFRDKLAKYLKENGVYSTFRYWPLNRVQYFGLSSKGLDNSEIAADITLNIPIHPALSDDDVSKIIDLVRRFKT